MVMPRSSNVIVADRADGWGAGFEGPISSGSGTGLADIAAFLVARCGPGHLGEVVGSMESSDGCGYATGANELRGLSVTDSGAPVASAVGASSFWWYRVADRISEIGGFQRVPR